MRKFFQIASGVTAAAILTAGLTATAPYAKAQPPAQPQAQAPAPPQKNAKDQGEFDISDAVVKDLLSKNFNKAITDLDTWTQKYPETDYKDDRLYDYEQAYAQANPAQPAKALEIATQLMDKDLAKTFPGQPQFPLSIYFLALSSARRMDSPSTAQLAVGDRAAHKLLEYAPVYFVDANKPAAAGAADWAAARKQVEDAANEYLYWEAVLPASVADQKKDYPAAEAAYTKAIAAYPDKSLLVYNLARSLQGQQKTVPAIWVYARAVGMDPTLGGSQAAKTISDYAKKVYVNYHGSDEGYDALLAAAKGSLLPPAGFTIKTAQTIAEEKEKEFETSHPDIALWMKIKAALTAPNGAEYFESGMKGASTPDLKGTVLEGACRTKTLLFAIPLPDATGPLVPEITIKLETALTGKPESGPISITGAVATEFTANPFMLTITANPKTDIHDLKTTPCAATVTKGAPKKGVTKKK